MKNGKCTGFLCNLGPINNEWSPEMVRSLVEHSRVRMVEFRKPYLLFGLLIILFMLELRTRMTLDTFVSGILGLYY